MAKDSFILYTEWSKNISILSDEQAGVLIKSLFAFARDEELPAMDSLTEMCYLFLQAQIDRDAKRYEEVKSIRSEAGKKGAAARWQNGKNGKRIFANGNANGKNSLYVDVDDNVDVNVNKDNVNNECITAWGRAQRESDDEKPDEDWDLRHQDDGRKYFNDSVKIGLVSRGKQG